MAKLRQEIGLKDLGPELQAFARGNQVAVRRAVERTIMVDAQRWIQWSIRGGSEADPQRSLDIKPVIKRPRKPKRTSIKSKLLKAIKRFFGKKPRRRYNEPKQPPSDVGPKSAYRPPIDTGGYARSWRGVMTSTGGLFFSVSSPRVLAGVIELGRRPGKGIPVAPLADWVRRKLGESDPERAKRIATAISFKQKRDGRPGLNVLGRAHPKIAEALAKNIVREMKAAASGG